MSILKALIAEIRQEAAAAMALAMTEQIRQEDEVLGEFHAQIEVSIGSNLFSELGIAVLTRPYANISEPVIPFAQFRYSGFRYHLYSDYGRIWRLDRQDLRDEWDEEQLPSSTIGGKLSAKLLVNALCKLMNVPDTYRTKTVQGD